MKFKKTTALITSLILAAGSFNVLSCQAADGTKYDCEGMTLYIGNSILANSEKNPGLAKINEAIISSDKEMIAIPSNVEDRITAEISSITSENTKYLYLPQSLMFINKDAFANCPELEAITIPNKVETIKNIDSDITIVGNENTYAEFFAEKNGNSFVLSGDINNDGKVGAADITGQIKYITGQKDFENGISKLAAELSGDGNVNVLDLILMKNKILEDKTVRIQSLAAPALSDIVRSTPEAEVQSGFMNFAAEYSDDILSAEDKNGGSNRIYSPLSIYMAFSMLAECCNGQSLDELLGFLDVSDKDELRKINHDLFTSLYFDDFSKYCKMANTLWISDRYTCEEDTIKNLADYYYSASFSRNLASEKDCSEISQWIYQNTAGKFNPNITPSTDSILKIINTVNFKEKWEEEFPGTMNLKFYTDKGETDCTFMNSMAFEEIYETDSYVKYFKNFQDDYIMNFILPAENLSTEYLLSDTEIMNSIFSNTKGTLYQVTSYIPKFSSSSKFDIIPVAKSLGVERIFNTADIAPLLDPDKNNYDNPYVDKITHEAVIDINEKGCEAAAYTVIETNDACSGKDVSPYIFRADRPFIYYISDTNGTPLFIGTVNNPLEK